MPKCVDEKTVWTEKERMVVRAHDILQEISKIRNTLVYGMCLPDEMRNITVETRNKIFKLWKVDLNQQVRALQSEFSRITK